MFIGISTILTTKGIEGKYGTGYSDELYFNVDDVIYKDASDQLVNTLTTDEEQKVHNRFTIDYKHLSGGFYKEKKAKIFALSLASFLAS